MLNKFVVQRLIIYNRVCKNLAKDGEKWVTSKAIADILSKKPAQVRRDISQLGKKGKPGVGYRIDDLVKEFNRVLGLNQRWNVALIGAGNLSRALFYYPGFQREGYDFKLIADKDPKKIGKNWKGIEITSTDNLVAKIKKNSIDIAIIAVPAGAAQEVTDKVVEGGIKEILNFAPFSLRAPEDVEIRYADLALELQNLSYTLKNRN